MFGPQPAFIVLTLDAALRDVHARRAEARATAMHALAGATLRELGRGEDPPQPPEGADDSESDTSPSFDALGRHPRGAEIRAALQMGLEADDTQLRGLAILGLGRLGDRGALAVANAALSDEPGDTEGGGEVDAGAVFLRECAVIALSHLGEAADGEAVDVHAEVLERLRTLAADPRPDVRFQAVVAMARVGGHGELARLRAMLETEAHAEVREHVVVALGMLDPRDEATSEAVAATLRAAREREGSPAASAEAFEAARLLAGAGRPDGRDELTAALRRQELRDDALEALAVLEPDALDDATVAAVRRLAQGWFTPAITRVRAAYCLSRARPDEGRAMLARFERHHREAVREAVRDAHAALARLDARGSS